MKLAYLSRALQAVKPHQPLIRFRKGSPSNTISQTSSKASSPNAAKGPAGNVVILEDFQLPIRFQRIAMNQAEIDAINCGGMP